jgi:hypothetical protein
MSTTWLLAAHFWHSLCLVSVLTKLQELPHQRVHYLAAARHSCYVTPRCTGHGMPVELAREVQHAT